MNGRRSENVRAIGVMLEDRNIVQVSINMVNYENGPAQSFRDGENGGKADG